VHINQIAREYARAIMQFASRDYSQVISFFDKISDCIKNSTTFSNLLEHPVIPTGEKFSAVMSLSVSELPHVVEKVVHDLVLRRDVDLISLISREMTIIHKKQTGIKDAIVSSAAPLNDQEKRMITASIEKNCGSKADVSFLIDSNLIAGYKIKIGDTVLDNTIRRQLQLVGDMLSFTNRV
jgi:F-type H+-transporting ATPase subunit delta